MCLHSLNTVGGGKYNFVKPIRVPRVLCSGSLITTKPRLVVLLKKQILSKNLPQCGSFVVSYISQSITSFKLNMPYSGIYNKERLEIGTKNC